jgi:NTE family protein
MSGASGWRPGFYAAARRHATRVLDREVRALEAAGIRTVVFAPGPEEQHAMGDDFMSREHLQEIIQESFLAAGRYAAIPSVGDVIRTAAG